MARPKVGPHHPHQHFSFEDPVDIDELLHFDTELINSNSNQDNSDKGPTTNRYSSGELIDTNNLKNWPWLVELVPKTVENSYNNKIDENNAKIEYYRNKVFDNIKPYQDEMPEPLPTPLPYKNDIRPIDNVIQEKFVDKKNNCEFNYKNLGKVKK